MSSSEDSDREFMSDFNTFSEDSDDTFSDNSDSTDDEVFDDFEIPFLNCCYAEVKKRLFRLPVPLRKTDERLVIAAKWAAIHGDRNMLKFLLSLIHHNSLFQDEKRILCEVFEKSRLACEAAHYGNLDCLEFLAEHCLSKEMILETGDSDHWTPAHYAAYNGRVKILKIHYRTCAKWCGCDGNEERQRKDTPTHCEERNQELLHTQETSRDRSETRIRIN